MKHSQQQSRPIRRGFYPLISMSFSKIVKSVTGKLSKSKKVVNASFVDLGNSSNGNGSVPGIRALSLHPEAGRLLQNYYGIDLTAIPAMSPEQLGELVDFLRQSEWMDTHLDKLKEHFKSYIDRQVSFNQFVAEVTKSGLKGAESIDKAGLDTYLAVKGYTQNSQKLGHKADLEGKYLGAELENYIDLENYSFDASLKSMALKLAHTKKEIDARPDKAAAQREIQLGIKAEKDRIGLLINYGTRGAVAMSLDGGGGGGSDTARTTQNGARASGGGGNIWTGLRDFFSGR